MTLTVIALVVLGHGEVGDLPTTLVLSRDTGYERPYDRDPYGGYERSDDLMFPPSRIDRRLAPKSRVLGLAVEGEALALSFERLARTKAPVKVRMGGMTITVQFDATSATAEASVGGQPLPAFTGFWFAWFAFHPNTKVWTEDASTKGDPATATWGLPLQKPQ